MGRFKKRGIEHYGIDYFRAVVTALPLSVLWTLQEGSNFIHIDADTKLELLPDVSDKWKRYFRVVDEKTSVSLAFIGL